MPASGLLWRAGTRATRASQTLSPRRSLPGLARLARLLGTILPPYTGVVSLAPGLRMRLDTRIAAERWLMVSGVYHPALTRAFRRHVPVGGYCLDAGANLGYFTLRFAHWVGPAGRVAAFEPNPAMVERIRQNVDVNSFRNVEIVLKAVHDRVGQVEFYVAGDPAKSSLDAGSVNGITNTVVAEATTLDAFVTAAGWTRLDAIKVDIEGNDCVALLASEDLLGRFRPFVAFEYKYASDNARGAETAAMFERLHYRLTALTYDGKALAFDWQTAPAGYKQVDVLCELAAVDA